MTAMREKPVAPRATVLVFAAIHCLAGVAFACKDREYPKRFPLDELSSFDHAYVIRVDKIDWAREPEGSWYAPAFTFDGRIEKSLKGPMHRGDAVRATTSTDEPHAACPIRLETGKTYLLMLNGTTSPYVLPRYGSLVVASDDKLFKSYVQTIARAGKGKNARQ